MASAASALSFYNAPRQRDVTPHASGANRSVSSTGCNTASPMQRRLAVNERQNLTHERQILSQSWIAAQEEMWPSAKHQAREWRRHGVHVGQRTCERYRNGQLPPAERLFKLISIYGWRLANSLVEPVIGVSALEAMEAANARKREEVAAAEARIARARANTPTGSLLAGPSA